MEAQAIIDAIERLGVDGLRENALCLDIGCGDGYITGELARHFGWRVVACDISGSALDMFRASLGTVSWSGGRNPQLVRSSVFSCPFGNAQFDLVTSFGRSSAGTYWPDAPAEVARILKPGGVAIFDFLNHFSLYYTLGQPLRVASVARRFVARSLRAHGDPNVSKMYHLGPLGIREFFDGFGLEIEASRFAVCHSPGLGGYWDLGRRLERGVPGPLRPLVGRSLIVKFRRRPDG